MRTQRITIVRRERPQKDNINEQLQWFGGSIGLFNMRDKDKSCFRIFITLLRNVKNKNSSSDELADELHLSRGTIVHHLNKLIEKGLVVSEKNRYKLQVDNLEHLAQQLKEEVDETLSELKEVAAHIDKKLKL